MSPQTGYGLLLALLCWPALAEQAPMQQPSLELLQFLGEFGDVDAETFDIIEHHAQQDREAQSDSPAPATQLTQENPQ